MTAARNDLYIKLRRVLPARIAYKITVFIIRRENKTK